MRHVHRFLPTFGVVLFVLLLFVLPAQAQIRTHKMSVTDTLRFAPGKPLPIPSEIKILQLFPAGSDPLVLQFRRYSPAIFVHKFSGARPDSVLISYRIFPQIFPDTISRMQDFEQIDSLFGSETQIFYAMDTSVRQTENRSGLLKEQKLQKSGSLSRGMTFGNNRNAGLNSSMNLQISGKLTEDLHLRAALSDRNVPFKPEGNTRNLSETERIFVNLTHPLASLTAGDAVLRNRESRFLRYFKNIKGGILESNYGRDSTDRFAAYSRLSYSGAEGIFRTENVEVFEGVQGPYRLQGPDNEPYIIILPGSERIFSEGRLLVRGDKSDYIIDYNTGEITFTEQFPVNKFSRIRAEYEYSAQNYGRNILSARHEQKAGRLSFFAEFYDESDNPRAPFLNLSDADKITLSEAGDDAEKRAGSSAFPVTEFSSERILYVRKDSLVGAEFYSGIYVRTTVPADTLWEVFFRETEAGKGDYVRAETGANGTVFQWVKPENGSPAGNFSPERILAAPGRKRMLTLGLKTEVGKYAEVFVEAAFSQRNLNLYSEKDAADDDGKAFVIGMNWKEKPAGANWLWKGNFSFEFDDADFRAIDRFRSPDFEREWSADLRAGPSDRIVRAGTGLDRTDGRAGMAYEFVRRDRGADVAGFQHRGNAFLRTGKWESRAEFLLVRSQKDADQIEWNRLNISLIRAGKKWSPGYGFRLEQNTGGRADSVGFSAMYFSEHRFFVRSSDSSVWNFSVEAALREDRLPVVGEMKKANRAENLSLKIGRNFRSQRFSFALNLRNSDDLLTDKNTFSLTDRLDWGAEFLGGQIRSDFRLSGAAGRELRREYRFVKVQTGLGTHTWRDANEDGVEELGEFFQAVNPDERLYIKLLSPTNDYLTAFSGIFNWQLRIQPKPAGKNAGKAGRFFRRFSALWAWNINKKTAETGFWPRILPPLPSPEADLIALNENLRADLFFDRNKIKGGFALRLRRLQQKQALSLGAEGRDSESAEGEWRRQVGRWWFGKFLLKTETAGSRSDLLADRNFRLRSETFSVEIARRKSRFFRLVFRGDFKQKAAENLSEKAEILRFTAESFLRGKAGFNWTNRLEISKINFAGNENSAVAYDLLEALRPGTNARWNVRFSRKIGEGLQGILSYDGRRSEDRPAVHLFSARLTAFF